MNKLEALQKFIDEHCPFQIVPQGKFDESEPDRFEVLAIQASAEYRYGGTLKECQEWIEKIGMPRHRGEKV